MSDPPLPPAPSPTPCTTVRVVPAHVLKQIDDEMDAAFRKNVAKSKADRKARQNAKEPLGAAMENSKPASSLPLTPPTTPKTSPTLSTMVRVASDADHQQIDREMDAAFVKNVAKNKKIQAERKQARMAQAAMTPPIEEIGPDNPISLDEEPCTPQDTSKTSPGPLRMQGTTNDERAKPLLDRMLQNLNDEKNRPRQTQRVPSAGATQLTPQRRAELKAEIRVLIAELKQFMSDPGNCGVPNSIFVAGWDGVRLKPPKI